MKFGCSLEMINMRTSGPNFIIRQSKGYWLEMLKLIAAAGFKGIELPYNPYSSDPVAFEVGRCGMPISRFAVNAKYESPAAFMQMLRDVGIEEITGVHINPNDIMLELIARDAGMSEYFNMLYSLADEAILFLQELGSKNLVLSVSPEIGLLAENFGRGQDGWQPDFVAKSIGVINEIANLAQKRGITLSLKNEFWGMAHGQHLNEIFAGLAPNIRFSADTAQLTIGGEDPALSIQAFSNRLAQIRFSDTTFTDVENNFRRINAEIPVKGNQRVFCDLGEGSVDFKKITGLLHSQNYDGWIICESRNTLNVHRALLKMRWFIDHELN